MEKLFKPLPTEILSQMLEMITSLSEEEYWDSVYRTKFSTEVLSKIDPKGYFSLFVVPKLNHGWELVGIGKYFFCDTCLPERHTHENCCNCNMNLPCLNCYCYGWYHCGLHNDEYQLVSWKHVQGFFYTRENKMYESFEDYDKKNKTRRVFM